MRYLYTLHGRNTPPCWGLSRRRQGRHVRVVLDLGCWWVGVYYIPRHPGS